MQLKLTSEKKKKNIEDEKRERERERREWAFVRSTCYNGSVGTTINTSLFYLI